MTQARSGSTVSIHYSGTLPDGTPFDSSAGGAPLVFEMGAGQIIPGLEAAIQGMTVGARKTVTVAAEQAYGPRQDDAVQTVPRDMIPDDIPVAIGTALHVQTPSGALVPVTVTALGPETVTLDANHPLAGQDLTFAVEVVAVS